MLPETVLIVDDEEEMAQLLKIELESEGFIVLTANDGKAALELVHKKRPSLVLLDVMMPELSGYEVLERLKQSPSAHKTIIIMLTAKGLDADIQKGLDLGADDYITKPFHAGLLIKRIQTLLTKGRSV